jgi:hypothetical protein
LTATKKARCDTDSNLRRFLYQPTSEQSKKKQPKNEDGSPQCDMARRQYMACTGGILGAGSTARGAAGAVADGVAFAVAVCAARSWRVSFAAIGRC